jgi:hypothetical protein
MASRIFISLWHLDYSYRKAENAFIWRDWGRRFFGVEEKVFLRNDPDEPVVYR